MKKFSLIFLISIILLTGCNENKEKEKNELSVYEFHYYDTGFEHTEDFIVKYDKDGNLKELEMNYLYDKRTDSKYCPDLSV